jgi:hypothetical protein
MKETFLKVLEWIGESPFRLFAAIILGIAMLAGWFVYTEKDAFMASYRAQQALPRMNGNYDSAANFIFKNSDAELVAIFAVNTLLNTRKLVYFVTRGDGRDKRHEGSDVGLLTKNFDNNNDVISLMSGKIPCSLYPKAQSFMGFVYKDKGINFMCRISVPAEAGLFIGQISVGWKEKPEDVEEAHTVMTVASSLLYGRKLNSND